MFVRESLSYLHVDFVVLSKHSITTHEGSHEVLKRVGSSSHFLHDEHGGFVDHCQHGEVFSMLKRGSKYELKLFLQSAVQEMPVY